MLEALIALFIVGGVLAASLMLAAGVVRLLAWLLLLPLKLAGAVLGLLLGAVGLVIGVVGAALGLLLAAGVVVGVLVLLPVMPLALFALAVWVLVRLLRPRPQPAA